MDKQNITLSIRKDVLQRVKIIAVKKGTSVSALLTQALEDIVAHEDGFLTARQEHVRLLEEGAELGTQGSTTWSREELHAR